ncbi:hypothetical protein SALBM135S_00300 [Streptomyces alboniger]
MQFVRGMSSTESGLLLLPLMLGMMARSLHRPGDRRRRRLPHHPIAGGAIATAGALALLTLGVDTATGTASALTLVLGAGLGCLLSRPS